MPLREHLKSRVERGLLASGVGRVGRLRLRGRTLVLAYHNVVPDDAPRGGDSSLHLSRARFAAQLDLLRAECDVVPLRELSRPTRGDRPRVAITFDDAYCGAVTLGVEELGRRGLPATFFVAPAFVGGRSFWWDALAPEGTGLDPAVREHALTALAGSDSGVRDWARGERRRLASPPPVARAASLPELERALASPGIEAGSHTWSHLNLARTPPEALERELFGSLRWLRERFPRVVPWLSYPYGRSAPAVERALPGYGYEGALRIEGGWGPGRPVDPFRVPRLNVPAGLSDEGFALRLRGLFCR